MKILYVQDSLGTGGAERSNAELWYFLRKEGISIKIVLLEHRKVGIEEEIINYGFDVIFLKPGNFLDQARQIAKIVKTYNPDLVHSVLFKATMRVRMAKLFADFYNIESLVNCSYDKVRFEDPKVNPYSLRVYKLLDQLTHHKGTDEFIAITEEVKRHHVEELKVPVSKISVIYRGREQNPLVDKKEEIRLALRKELDLDREDLVFVHVGRQEFQKGHLVLLKAIKEQDEELRKLNVNFIFCGRKGNATEELEVFLKENPVKTSIKFLGHTDDIYRILAGSDVFVFPSLYEGLGGSLIEAQAAGLPIICSNIKVFQEVVNQKNAEFFEVSNSSELGEKLVKLGNSGKLREEMEKESLYNFHRKFQLEEINRKTLNHYKKFIS